MNRGRHSDQVRSVAGSLVALGVASVAWLLSPTLITLLGLDDLEFLARIACVVLSLSVAEAVFARLPGADGSGH